MPPQPPPLFCKGTSASSGKLSMAPTVTVLNHSQQKTCQEKKKIGLQTEERSF